MSLDEKYKIIEYRKYLYSPKKYYDAFETKDFFDDELCKQLLKNINELTNAMTTLGEHFDFSLIFSNIDKEPSEFQEYLLTFLILKEVKNIDFVKKIKQDSILSIMDKIYLKNESNDKNILSKIIKVLDDDQAIIFINHHINQLSDEQIANCIKMLYADNKDNILKNIILSNNKFQQVFIFSVPQPFFYEMVEMLQLDDSFIINRQQYLKSILSEPTKYSNETLKDTLCDYYFNERFYNVMLDLKTITEALDSIKFNDCPAELKSILDKYYLFFRDFDYKKEEEITKFVEEFDINKKLLDKMYEYAQKLFKDSILQSINNRFENVKKSTIKSSSGKDVSINYFSNDTFEEEVVMLISTIPVEHSALDFIKKFFGTENGELRYKRRSCSLINQSRLTSTFGTGNHRIMFGYSDLSERKITSATLADGQTDGNEIKYRKKRKTRRCRFINIQDFILQTKAHNEISLEYEKELDYKINIPSYILVIDREPSQLEIDIADYMNIPIRIFDTTKYIQDYSEKKRDVEEQYDYAFYPKLPISLRLKALNQLEGEDLTTGQKTI